MKKRMISATALVCAVIAAAMCLTACGGSNGDASTEITTIAESSDLSANKTLTEADGVIGGALEDGTYKMTTIYLDGEESTKYFSSLKKLGINMYLVVKGDQIKIMESEYTLKDGKFVSDEGTSTYAVNGSKITVLDDDDSKMVFEKE